MSSTLWRISEAKGSGMSYVGDARGIPLEQAFQELWCKYSNDAAPLNAETSWDHLRIELWLDSGRVILFPAKRPFQKRFENALCQINCPELLNFYETLIEAHLPDEKFEVAMTQKEKEIAEMLSVSAREADLPEHLGKDFVRVLIYGADLENPMKEEVLKRL